MRYPEIDLLKGIAVILMVFFHYFYVAYLMEQPIVDINSTAINSMASIAHNIFIFMVGVNLIVSYKSHQKKEKSEDEYIGRQFRRALMLLMIGMFITLTTYFIFPDKFVRFGIFHFISLAIMMSLLFVNNIYCTGLGIVLFSLLNYIIQNHKDLFYSICENNKLSCFIMGIYNYYGSIDHFSFIPFFLIILYGIGAGQIIYGKGQRNFDFSLLDKTYQQSKALQSLGYIGKQSLNIYLVHFIIIYYILSRNQN